jgi:hypothetical protein
MLLFALAVFAGSQSCRPCHAKIADAYAQTPMARSSGKVKANSIPKAEFTAGGHRYRIDGGTLFFADSSVPLDYYIGSNALGRSFIFEREGFLYELPVTWYSRKNMWAASPGYEREPEVRLDRPVDRTCLACHASRLRPVLGTQNRYGDPPFLEGGVACERCHGPGSEHVKNPAAAKMVNPAKLAPEARDSVCTQCHLTGATRIEHAGRRFAEFRAGDKLGDLVTYFVWSSGAEDPRLTSHVERLAASRCKRESRGKLWCGTCHSPHTNANRTQSACVECHAQAHHKQESCTACHMPQLHASDIAHGSVTDHSIPRVPGQNRAAPAPRELIPFLGTPDARSLGLSYAEFGDPRARQYLERAEPRDVEVLLRMATLERDPLRAAALYEAVLRVDPARPAALVNLGVLYANAGHRDEAARLWKRALRANPNLEGPALNLSRIIPPAEAQQVLERYLSFNPGSAAARKRLEELKLLP